MSELYLKIARFEDVSENVRQEHPAHRHWEVHPIFRPEIKDYLDGSYKVASFINGTRLADGEIIPTAGEVQKHWLICNAVTSHAHKTWTKDSVTDAEVVAWHEAYIITEDNKTIHTIRAMDHVHASDCAIFNAPAMPPGSCNCRVLHKP